MSTCISPQGEFSDHILDAYTCTRCLVLDEDALVAELRQMRAERNIANQLLADARLVLWPEGGARRVPQENVLMLPEAVEWLLGQRVALTTLLDETETKLADVQLRRDTWHTMWREVRRELEAARPVVEAAVAYREARYTPGAGAAGDLLVAAVDLYRSATSDHPSTTEEKP